MFLFQYLSVWTLQVDWLGEIVIPVWNDAPFMYPGA